MDTFLGFIDVLTVAFPIALMVGMGVLAGTGRQLEHRNKGQ